MHYPIQEVSSCACSDKERISIMWLHMNVADVSMNLAIWRGSAAIAEDIVVSWKAYK